ncbi:MAG TPA: hypothetical protein GX743_02745 [Actinomycetales bacterium]|nr:hypothetical protein [Actinomycetales bacterium]
MTTNYPSNPPFGQQPGQGGPADSPNAPSAASGAAPQQPSWGAPAPVPPQGGPQQGAPYGGPRPGGPQQGAPYGGPQGGPQPSGPQQGAPYGAPYGAAPAGASSSADNLTRYLVVGAFAGFALVALLNWIMVISSGYASAWSIISGLISIVAWSALTFGIWKVFDIVDEFRARGPKR